MTMKTTTAILLTLTLGAAVLGQTEKVKVDKDTLAGKRFRFSWSSDSGSAVNGTAVLKEDGSIDGIGSPNESAWSIDEAGRLLFKHTDGRVSTRYDEVRLEDGLLCFKGPFLFRDGITHHLIELKGADPERKRQITPEQAARIKYSTQSFVYLDPGQTYTFKLKNGAERRIRLVSVEEYTDSVVNLKRGATVKVEIDGKPLELACAPYVMPTETQGLRIQADTTTGWMPIPKRVQFSLWDATDPIVDTSQLCFPLPGYRLFSQGTQAYNEPVHWGHRDGDPVGGCFYHNYGVDLAGYEGRQKVVSCIDGVVVLVGRQDGDLAIRDDRGMILYYGHLDAILTGIRPGVSVKRGQWVAMLGKRGGSGNFAHLHVGTYPSETAMAGDGLNRNLNLYPWLVTAYQAEAQTSLYAVARPHHTVLTGEKILFDGSNSMAFDSKIASYKWEFHDGASSDGPRAEKVYDKPGCYMATLWVKDSQGRTDVDFCKVKVYSKDKPEDIVPILFVTYTPSREVRPGQAVSFRLWPQGRRLDDIKIDFGDGTVIEDYRSYSAVSHAFKTPGIHIVTVTGKAGTLPATQKVKVVVQE